MQCTAIRTEKIKCDGLYFEKRRGMEKKISWFAFEKVVVKIKEDQEKNQDPKILTRV